jgi:SagB-type dehydrogenase family enzyme
LNNDDTRAARAFHAATKYRAIVDPAGQVEYLMGTPPTLVAPIWQEDYSIEPRPYKRYTTLQPLPLPTEFARTALPALAALARTGADGERSPAQAAQGAATEHDAFGALSRHRGAGSGASESLGGGGAGSGASALARRQPPGGTPDLAALARLARFTNGLLNRRVTTQSGRVVEFRTAGATGARYHLELYFVCGDLADLAAGVYHYAADDHSLRQLRPGDLRGVLVAASGGERRLAEAPVVLAITSTFWRNAWRYKARAYRHTFWDTGTSLANCLAVAASLDLPAELVLGYADAPVNALLGVDGESEATVALCALGRAHDPGRTTLDPGRSTRDPGRAARDPGRRPPPAGAWPADAPARLPAIAHPVEPVSSAEVVFDDIPRLHAASSLASGQEAATWRQNPLQRTPRPPTQPPIPLAPLADDAIPSAPIEDVILSRRSTRAYDTRTPISFEAFSTLLDRSVRGFAADCLSPGAPPLHDGYLIVNAVEGLAPGLYLHRASEGSLEPIRTGDFRAQAAHLAFDQQYAADAHVNSYYLTDLEPVLAHYGNRGYRLAQLEAALYAGRLHLAAHALGLGAVGSTSFDDEVADFFSPPAVGASFMFVTVFGARRRRAHGHAG